ncbi:hypothetical protein BCR33DRAFT_713523 [Rhizoclosmatium globosum]|uniref:RNI-like protein n=1 Tax=Rhizoclosmatium globosum TaxID=329046 RepID=A0A1Y2CSD6_9FUNG|nr:hypothetical protein BCR33DRAFT_713523 [Rhizoclosmatium globosum]|eukprot:ORY49922.1 hypothetical protein BCR33DRAFT_713523 [Rhizoclosmatium globosum]
MTTSCHRHRILDGGGTTPFGQTYFQACLNRQSPVLAQVISPALEMRRHLHIDIDSIKKEEDWEPIMKALRVNEDLKEIRLRSNMGPGMQGISSDVIIDVGNSIQRGGYDQYDETSSMSTTRNVQLNYATQRGLPDALRKKDRVQRGSAHVRMGKVAIKLMSSIKECMIRSNRITVLEIAELSLARSNIGDDGLFTLIPGIKAAKALCSVNLAACQLTPKGADFLSNLIKSQAVQRQAAHWVSTLRAHPLDPLREGYPTKELYNAVMAGPTLEVPIGTPTPIRRLNLCCNIEEIGMLAIDVQYNNITDAGGRIVEQIVRLNGELVIVDVRNNRIDPILLRIITSLLQVNMTRRLKAAEMPLDTNGKRKPQPQQVEWLSETHPLESTFHSTSTTSTSSIPYESVRVKIRQANQTFATTQAAEAELRRKRRKWDEVEDAAKIHIPKGNLYPQSKQSKNYKQTKASKSKQYEEAVPAKIPAPAWTTEKPPVLFESVQDVELEIISDKLNNLLSNRKPEPKSKAELSTTREAHLWAENQALKQRLYESQRKETLTRDENAWSRPSRNKVTLREPQRATTESSESLKYILQDYCDMPEPLSIIDNLLDLHIGEKSYAIPLADEKSLPPLPTKVMPRKSNLESIDKLAAELDFEFQGTSKHIETVSSIKNTSELFCCFLLQDSLRITTCLS